jgi:hypothetical protein
MTTSAKLAIALPVLVVVALLLKLFIGPSSEVRNQPRAPDDVIEAAP